VLKLAGARAPSGQPLSQALLFSQHPTKFVPEVQANQVLPLGQVGLKACRGWRNDILVME